MRSQDMTNLKKLFTPSEDPEIAFPQALGIDTPEVEVLYREIFGDLDEKVFGIGWWAPHPGTSRRILISNYLLECIRSIRTNLTEAALHLLEAVDYWDKEGDFLANCVSIGKDGKPHFEVPKRTSPGEDLARRMATLHAVGFFRALVGALDCLGASVVGVLAIPASITFADLKTTRKILLKSQNPIHIDFRTMLDGILLATGPAGWTDWVYDFRNMVVHRGRRVNITQLVPRRVPLLGPDGKVIPRATIAEHLPSDPCSSQVEAFLDNARSPVLTEHAETTLRGALNSVIDATRKTAIELSKVWAFRRKDPIRLTQPKENWPAFPDTQSTGFEGYNPGSVPYNPLEWHAHHDLYRLFSTAALSDDLRPRWKEFD
jgi:hypothetical protein